MNSWKSVVALMLMTLPAISQRLPDPAKGFLELNGQKYPVIVRSMNGHVEKYLELGNGAKMDLREYFKSQMDVKKRKYGNFSVRLNDHLETLNEMDSLDIIVNFRVPESRGSMEHGKQTAQEAYIQAQRAFQSGLTRIAELHGIPPRTPRHFSSRAKVKQRVTKAQAFQLKHDPEIASLDLPYAKPPVSLNLSSLASSYGNIGTDGGLDMSAICGQYCGQNITLGIMEGSPLSPQKRTSYLNGPWFITRPGTPEFAQNDHPWMVAGVVRNSVGAGTYQYDMGGSRHLPRMLHATNLDSDIGIADDYDWALGENAAITNNSNWLAKFNATVTAASHEKDRYYDIRVATFPYPFSIVSAGNGGETSHPDGENKSCQSISAATKMPWTAEECQRVLTWGHNTLIVGAVDNATTRSDFSSFRDGASGDEAPHVVARGRFIEFPWDAPYSPTEGIGGTSIAAPTVASFATNLLSKYSALRNYPEAMRVIIMASATKVNGTRWPTESHEDFSTGAGIPNGSVANAIAANKPTGEVFTTGRFGYQTSVFSGGISNGSEINRSITITNNTNGYIHWWLTWVGNPVNHPAGIVYPADDLDLLVTASGVSQRSTSIDNSTEHVAFYQGSGSLTYDVKIKLYYRNTDPNHSIYLALAWAYHSSP